MRYGLIIAAGKQSRFKSDIPKALVKIGNETLLDLNMRNLKKFCDTVYVVCSKQNETYFRDYEHLTINSGFGCGDAVGKVLMLLPLKKEDEVFIQWGDCLLEERVYKRCIEEGCDGKVVIPTVIEDKPYVQIVDKDGNVKVLFSKFGDKTERGNHDLSVFYSNAIYLRDFIYAFVKKFVNPDNTYTHPHGNEYNFLDTFNETEIKGKTVMIEDYIDRSFNTLEQIGNLTK